MKYKIDKEYWANINQGVPMEFDWIGIDISGHIGVFSSLNQGYIPQQVLFSIDKYQLLHHTIHNLPSVCEVELSTTRKGIFKDWIEYASKGLFAFDYQDAHRTRKLSQYDIIARPLEPITINNLPNYDTLKEIVPRFNLTFESHLEFRMLSSKLIAISA